MKLYISELLIMLLFATTLTGCQSTKTIDGITLIASRGEPPAQSMVWSPTDPYKILVTSGRMGPGGEVYIYDIEKKKKTLIAKTDAGFFNEAVWTPDGKDIFISSGDNTHGFEPRGWWKVTFSNGSSEYLANLDDKVVKWSLDGKVIATSAGNEIILTNLDTGRKQSYNTNVALINSFGISWSADRQYLVFPAGASPIEDLYVLNIKTQKVTKITENKEIHTTAWSPVGDIIAYINTSPIDGNKTLHLIRSDGNCDIGIPGLENVLSLSWSPDGKRLGFIGRDGIYYADLNTLLGRDIYQNLCP